MSIKTVTKNVLGRELSEHNKQLGLSTLAKAKETSSNLLQGLLNKMDDNYILKEYIEKSFFSVENSDEGIGFIEELYGNSLKNHTVLNGFEIEPNKEVPERHNRFTADIEYFSYKRNTDYTIIINIKENSVKGFNSIIPIDGYKAVYDGSFMPIGNKVGIHMVKVKTKDINSFNGYVGFQSIIYNPNGEPISGKLVVDKIMILEGDWTNRDIPNFFDKITFALENTNIECRNKNLIYFDFKKEKPAHIFGDWLTIKNDKKEESLCLFEKKIKVEPNTTYTYSFTSKHESGCSSVEGYIYEHFSDNMSTYAYSSAIQVPAKYDPNEARLFRTFTTNMKTRYIVLRCEHNGSKEAGLKSTAMFKDFMLCKGTSSEYIPTEYNTKTLPNFESLKKVYDAEDRLFFMNNKLMIERNVSKAILDGSSIEYTHFDFAGTNTVRFGVVDDIALKGVWDMDDGSKSVLCETLPCRANYSVDELGYYKDVNRADGKLIVRIPKGTITNEVQLKEYLKQNPLVFYYKRNKPIYEEIEIDKIMFNTYKDFSLNLNSNIPPAKVVLKFPPFAPVLAEARSNIMTNETIKYDINGYIVPQFMDMEFKLLELEKKLGDKLGNITMKANLTVEEVQDIMTSQERTFEMLKRDISSKRLTYDQAVTRVTAYSDANRITKEHEQELLLLASEQLK